MQRPWGCFNTSVVAQKELSLGSEAIQLFTNPSDLVNFQISFLESRRTSEHGETVPELLLQRADNKTKTQNSHPQTSQTPHTSNCKQSLRPGKSSQRDPGSRAQRQQAAVQPQRQGSLGSSVHVGKSIIEGYFLFWGGCLFFVIFILHRVNSA